MVTGEALIDLVLARGRQPRRSSGRRSVQRRPHDRPLAPAGRVPRPPLDRPAPAKRTSGCSSKTASAWDASCHSDDPTTLALASVDADGRGPHTASIPTRHAAAGTDPRRRRSPALPERVAALHVGTLGLVLDPLASAMEAVVERPGEQHDRGPRSQLPARRRSPTPARTVSGWPRVLARSALAQGQRGGRRVARPRARVAGGAARALLKHGPSRRCCSRAAATGPPCSAHGAEDRGSPRRPGRPGRHDRRGRRVRGRVLAWWVSHGLGRDQTWPGTSSSWRPRRSPPPSRR